MLGCGYVVYCPLKQAQEGIVLQLDEKDEDTIIGYSCSYPNCYPSICMLPMERPIGKSIYELNKKNINKP